MTVSPSASVGGHAGTRSSDVPVVVILTQDIDNHADFVVEALADYRCEVVRFNPGDFPQHSSIRADYDGDQINGIFDLRSRDRSIDLSRLHSVWYRRPTRFDFPLGLNRTDERFARSEATAAITGLLQAAAAKWVNDPAMEARAGLKPLQLRIAQKHNLAVPRSLITSEPEAVLRFYNDCDEQIIYKPLGTARLFDSDGVPQQIWTSVVDRESLNEVNRVTTTPCLFQEQVTKAHELRVTIIGDKVFTARLESQRLEATAVDWRRDQVELEHVRDELPDDVEQSLRGLMQELGLVFGAIDMIVQPDGRHVFLEVNPSGQWQWIEDRLGYPMTTAMCDLLLT